MCAYIPHIPHGAWTSTHPGHYWGVSWGPEVVLGNSDEPEKLEVCGLGFWSPSLCWFPSIRPQATHPAQGTHEDTHTHMRTHTHTHAPGKLGLDACGEGERVIALEAWYVSRAACLAASPLLTARDTSGHSRTLGRLSNHARPKLWELSAPREGRKPRPPLTLWPQLRVPAPHPLTRAPQGPRLPGPAPCASGPGPMGPRACT